MGNLTCAISSPSREVPDINPRISNSTMFKVAKKTNETFKFATKKQLKLHKP
jgi:hypothetical protein